MNDIYLRRRMRLCVQPGSGGLSQPQLATVLKEIESLGFVLSEPLMARVATLTPETATRFLRDTVRAMRLMVGAHREYTPLYPGFPDQVMNMTKAMLYLGALEHYLTLRRAPLPDTPNARPPLLNNSIPRLVNLGSKEDFEAICTQLAGAAASLSAQDQTDLSWFIRQYRADVFRLLPKKFPFKENLALVAAQLVLHVAEDAQTQQLLDTHIRTATDVLRLAVGLSGGDLSLATATRFTRFSRPQRRLLLTLLERCSDLEEGLHRWPEPFKRLGERLHPGEHAQSFPRVAAAFDMLRNGLPNLTFNSKVERALSNKDFDEVAKILEARPGEYARRLDNLLRKAPDPKAILTRFADLAPRVSTAVLLQMQAHFKARHEQHRLRVFTPKGDMAKLFALNDRRLALPEPYIQQVIHHCEQALLSRFAQLPPLGRCHVDSTLSRYVVPMTQRAASKSLRTLARGSRIPLPDAGFVRMFLWWMNGKSRVDIDLSVALFNSDYRHLDTIAFYNLRGWGAYHSGDIVDAPKGAAEFIDLDLKKLQVQGVRYVVMNVNSYSGQAYCDLPECFAGWMSRSNLNSGEPFEARTVIDRVDLAANTQICLPLVLDIQQREVLWADIALTRHPRFANTVAANLSGVALMLRALQDMVKPDLYTLFTLHARARGTLVDIAEMADTRFGTDNDCTVTPLDGDEIRSAYLQ